MNAIEPGPLKIVFKAFCNEIFGERVIFPDYDGINKIIETEINKLIAANKPVFFTWMTRKETKAALKHMRKNPVPDIDKDIADPSKINFNEFKYPDVDFEHFTKSQPGPVALSQCSSSEPGSSSDSFKIII